MLEYCCFVMVGLSNFNSLLEEMAKKLKYESADEDISLLRNLFTSNHFRAAVKVCCSYRIVAIMISQLILVMLSEDS